MDDFYHSIMAHYFSDPEIERVRAATIGIAGCGGLGSNCAVLLARCGFERFILVDFDRVEASNLNRQAYHSGHIGRLKIECLSEILRSINQRLLITTHSVRVDAGNVHALFDECTAVIEAFDRPECKSMIVEAFIDSSKLIVSASGLGGYGNSDRIVTRKIRDNFYLIGDGRSEIDDLCKPHAPCVAIAAAKQADAILSWILKGKRADAGDDAGIRSTWFNRSIKTVQ